MSGRLNPRRGRASSKEDSLTAVPLEGGPTSSSSRSQAKKRKANASPSPAPSDSAPTLSSQAQRKARKKAQKKAQKKARDEARKQAPSPGFESQTPSGDEKGRRDKKARKDEKGKTRIELDKERMAKLKEQIEIAFSNILPYIERFSSGEKIATVMSGWTSALDPRLSLEPKVLISIMSNRLEGEEVAVNAANSLLDQYHGLWKKVQNASGLPPSEFAKAPEWLQCQELSPILCLRPSTATGVPLPMLYKGFRVFRIRVSDPNLPISPGVLVSAAQLSQSMGNGFQSEGRRSDGFDNAVKTMLPIWGSQYRLTSFPGHASANVDRVIMYTVDGELILIFREDKLEAGSTASDAYMQMARTFDMYIVGLSLNPDPNIRRYLAAGAPAFLLVVQGTKGSFPSALPIVQFKLTF
ncbi:hypothetical protein MD484_g9088, partial [Candolleomyces efflorescens]